jgi:uncharacterized protein YegL
MIGPGIAGVRKSVDAMLKELRRNPHALETVYMSFITFSTKAKQLMPLTPLEDIQPPSLPLASGTALGDALALAAKSIKSEVRKGSVDVKGDFRPIVFIITDGVATDKWQSGAADLKATKATIYGIGCGDDVDWNQLGSITPAVLHVDAMDSEAIGSLFRWISSSVDTASRAVSDGDDKSALDKLPAAVKRIDLSKAPVHDGNPRQVFIKVLCQQGRGGYLLRYSWSPDNRNYFPKGSHPLVGEDSLSGGSALSLPKVDSRKLDGCSPCPYCEAAGVIYCPQCSTVSCLSDPPPSRVVCAGCRMSGSIERKSFNVDQRSG